MAGVRFIQHESVRILYVDFSNSGFEAIRQVVDKARPIIASEPEGSVLTLTNAEGVRINKDISDLMKDFTRHNKPYVKAGAVLGVRGIVKITFHAAMLFSGRKNLQLFDDEQEARDWLVTRE